MAFQRTTNDKGKEASSTSCTLVQSVRLWASWKHNQRAKRRGPWQLSALADRIWPQVIRSCEITGRRKGEEEEKEEEKGNYLTSSLLCWASTLHWLLALKKLHPCPSRGFGHGATGTTHSREPTMGTSLPPGKLGRVLLRGTSERRGCPSH